MNREIKFRGLRTDGKEWVYGSLSMVDTRSQRTGQKYGQMFICNVQTSWQNTENGKLVGYWIEVLPESVSQFTGLHDKNGKEIYEGDVLKSVYGNGYIVFEYIGFAIKSIGSESIDFEFPSFYLNSEVIGNIYENPELL